MNQDQARNRITIAKWYLGRVKEALSDIQDQDVAELMFQMQSHLDECESDLVVLKDFYTNKLA